LERVEHPRLWVFRRRWGTLFVGDDLDQFGAGLLDFGAPLAPGGGDPLEHLLKRRQAVAWPVREVRAAVEGLAIGRQEHVERPAPATCHRLHRVHVDRIEIGPLLSVNLDGHEVTVHLRGRRFVLEGLTFHDVAPMARRVANRQEDRFGLGAGARQRLLAPGIPIDRVVGVLQEVGTCLLGQAVRHLG